MCAAIVRVLEDGVVAKHVNQVIGRGRLTYELRDFDAALDAPGAPVSHPSSGIAHLTLEIEDIGRAKVSTRRHDTMVIVEATRVSLGAGSPSRGRDSFVILDETYGYGQPVAVPIVDADARTLAVVTHRSLTVPEPNAGPM